MASPFSLFTTTSYTFLELDQGTGGNKVVSETASTGIVKLRDGMTQDGNAESYTSSSTVHIRPTEPFIAEVGGHLKLVGHGMRIGADDYRIEGVTEGKDFDTGEVSFYRATLKKERLWESALPIE